LFLNTTAMNSLLKIIKYTFYDTFRSWWAILYFLFFLISSTSLLYFSGDFTKAVSGMLNIIILIIPLVSIIFGAMFYYSSREFVELLLAQPLKRSIIFLGQYLGLALSMISSFFLALTLSFIIYQGNMEELGFLILLLLSGIFLTFIFTGLSFLISATQEDKIKGFGMSILLWLFLAIIYDGIFLAVLAFFQDYPMDTASIYMSLLNPVDLTRIFVLLRLESATLMGFTGAVYKKFFGTFYGAGISLLFLVLWILIPLSGFFFKIKRKDF